MATPKLEPDLPLELSDPFMKTWMGREYEGFAHIVMRICDESELEGVKITEVPKTWNITQSKSYENWSRKLEQHAKRAVDTGEILYKIEPPLNQGDTVLRQLFRVLRGGNLLNEDALRGLRDVQLIAAWGIFVCRTAPLTKVWGKRTETEWFAQISELQETLKLAERYWQLHDSLEKNAEAEKKLGIKHLAGMGAKAKNEKMKLLLPRAELLEIVEDMLSRAPNKNQAAKAKYGPYANLDEFFDAMHEELTPEQQDEVQPSTLKSWFKLNVKRAAQDGLPR